MFKIPQTLSRLCFNNKNKTAAKEKSVYKFSCEEWNICHKNQTGTSYGPIRRTHSSYLRNK